VLGLKPFKVVVRRDKKFLSSLRYIGAYIGSRDSFIRITIFYEGLKGITMRRDKVLSSPPRNFRNQPLIIGPRLCDGVSLDMV
jgi:hypothetical protein